MVKGVVDVQVKLIAEKEVLNEQLEKIKAKMMDSTAETAEELKEELRQEMEPTEEDREHQVRSS